MGNIKTAGLFAFSMAMAFSGLANANDSAWERIKSTGELRCGANVAQKPLSWRVDEPAEYEGTAINTCRAVAEDLGAELGKPVKIKWVEFTYATVVLDLQAARFDMAAGMTATEERKKSIDMPGPLYSFPDAVVYKKGFTPSDQWADYNRKELKVASLQGSGSEATVHAMLPDANNLSFKCPGELYLSVQSGHADVFVIGLAQGLLAMSENGDSFGGIVYPSPKKASSSGLGIRRDADGQFNKWLQAWTEKRSTDGTMSRLVRDAFMKAGVNVALLDGSGM